MGGEVTCRNRKVSWRRVPEDIGWALGSPLADTVCVVKCHWSVNGEPAAISTAYLPGGRQPGGLWPPSATGRRPIPALRLP